MLTRDTLAHDYAKILLKDNLDSGKDNYQSLDDVAFQAVKMADALILALNKNNGGKDVLSVKIQDTSITSRGKSALVSDGIFTVSDLTKRTEVDLLKIPNLSKITLLNIKDYLSMNGLSLKC